MEENKKVWYTLIFLVIIGAILRFTSINMNLFWHDEVWTFVFAKMPFWEIWHDFVLYEPTPPLFYWLCRVITVIAGFNPLYYRPLAAIFGVALIPVMYFIGKEYIDVETGLAAAFLIALNPFNIYFSQEARVYTLMMFLNAVTLYVYIRYLKEPKWPWITVFAVVAAISIWAQWFSGILIALLVIHMVISRQNFKHTALFVFLTAIPLIPLVSVAIEHAHTRTFMPQAWGYQGIDLIWMLLQTYSGFNWIAVIVMTCGFIGGTYYGLKMNKKVTTALLMLTLIPAFFGVAISYTIPMTPRYLSFVFVSFIVGISPIVSGVLRHAGEYRKHAIALFIIVVVVSGLPFYAINYTVTTKFDWNNAMRIINNQTYKGDYIVTVPSSIQVVMVEHYALTNPPPVPLQLIDGNSFDQIKDQYNLSAHHNLTYIVDTAVAEESEATVWGWFANHTTLVYEDKLGKIYYVTRKNLSTSTSTG